MCGPDHLRKFIFKIVRRPDRPSLVLQAMLALWFIEEKIIIKFYGVAPD